MRLGVLTSSRADYSIYLPLLRAIQNDSRYQLDIIVFGTHLSEQSGATISSIEADGFHPKHKIMTAPEGDTPEAISQSMGLAITRFSHHWGSQRYDLVFCLGDRYEMFAACASAVPFGIRLAHIQGGETTEGAIDNIFRHQMFRQAIRAHDQAVACAKGRCV